MCTTQSVVGRHSQTPFGNDKKSKHILNPNFYSNPKLIIDSVLNKTFNVAFSDYVSLRGAEGWNGKAVGAGLPDNVIGIDLASLDKNDTGLVYRNEIIAYIKENGTVDESTGAVKDGRVQMIP